MKRRLGAGLLIVALIGGLVSAAYATLRSPETVQLPPPIYRDLSHILERDTLVALTSYNPTSYFLYRGQALGYEYELLQAFAEEQDLELKMLVVPRDSLLPMLNRGVGDVAAASLIPTNQDTVHFRYTVELYRTRPVVVQREAPPEDARLPGERRATPADSAVLPRRLDSALAAGEGSEGEEAPGPLRVAVRPVRRAADLAGTEVYLPSEHPYVDRLIELESRLDGAIYVVEVDTTSESLIREVARGDINFTVAPENIAELEESYYTNLSIRPTVGPTHSVTWAVRGNSPALLSAFNSWIEENRDGAQFRSLYRKYYVDRQAYRDRVESRYLTGETGTLSAFDAVLRAAAATIGWDWRLLASQAYQESRFDARAQSWAGAMGLLQLMPATAREIGVSDPWDPEANAMGAARYLRWLERNYWNDAIADPRERLKFVLASYNAGAGHVMDAQRLAEAEGDDPNVWEDVAYWMLEKSKPEVYNRPEVRHGFVRGLEPVQYVARILDRYDHYRQFVPDQPGAPSAARLRARRDSAGAAAPQPGG